MFLNKYKIYRKFNTTIKILSPMNYDEQLQLIPQGNITAFHKRDLILETLSYIFSLTLHSNLHRKPCWISIENLTSKVFIENLDSE